MNDKYSLHPVDTEDDITTMWEGILELDYSYYMLYQQAIIIARIGCDKKTALLIDNALNQTSRAGSKTSQAKKDASKKNIAKRWNKKECACFDNYSGAQVCSCDEPPLTRQQRVGIIVLLVKEVNEMMTCVAMAPAIGSKVRVQFEKITVDMYIQDVKHAYGNTRYLVTPIQGDGQQWIESPRIKAVAQD